MSAFIPFFIILPTTAFLLSILIPKTQERIMSILAYCSVGIQLLAALVFTGFWFRNGMSPINIKEFSVYKTGNYDFFIDFYFDKITMV
ncbi:MAG: hypothetical protein ACKO7P_00105, partial [Bacteroidota bacterium]